MWIKNNMRKNHFLGALGCSLALLSWSSASLASKNFDNLETIPSVKSGIAHSQLLNDVVVTGDKVVTVGAYGHILMSSDNGQTWKQSNVPVNLLLTAVDFPTDQHGWAVGHEGVILHTADGGENWDIQHANPIKEISDEEYDSMSDEDFTKLPQMGAPVLDVFFKNENEGFVVGAYGLFLCTTDGGKNWEDCASRIENFDGWHLNSIASNGAGVLYIVGEKGVAFRSDDNGDTWQTLESPYEGSYFGLLAPAKSDEVIIFGLQGKTFRSPDRGASWKKVNHKAQTGIMDGVQFNSSGVILVGNSGAILTSHDDGSTFKLQSTATRKHIVAIEKLPNGKLVFVGQGGVTLGSPNIK